LPAYEGSRNVAIHAVYASRRFLPAKVRVFIDYLAELYGPVPYWDQRDKSVGSSTAYSQAKNPPQGSVWPGREDGSKSPRRRGRVKTIEPGTS
jgi:hypothetical protein